MGWGGVKTFMLRCVSSTSRDTFMLRCCHFSCTPMQAGAGPLSTLASGGGVFDNFRSSARRPELGDKPSPVPGVDT